MSRGREKMERMDIRRVVPNIRTSDMEATKAFYVEFLGFEVAMDMGWLVTFASPTNPTAQINVSPGDPMPDGAPQPYLSIEVEDADAAHAAAVRHGYEVVYPLTDEPWGLRRFFVRDPSGLVVNLIGPPRAP